MSELIAGGTPEPSALWQDWQFSRYRSAPDRRKSPSGPSPEDGRSDRPVGEGAQFATRPMLDAMNGIPRCLSQLSPSTAEIRRPLTTRTETSFLVWRTPTDEASPKATPAKGRQTATRALPHRMVR